MKKIRRFIIGFFWLLLFAMGCQDDDMALDRMQHEADMPMNAVFELKLAVDGRNGMTRATKQDSTIGHAMESCISTVQLFAVPVDDSGVELWDMLRFGQTTVTQNSDPITVHVPEFVFDRIHVYVGANMDREQAEAFIRSKSGYYEITRGTFRTYYSAINQLAPFVAKWEPSYDRNPENIVMFSTAALEADRNMIEEIEDGNGEKKKRIKLGTATLKRVVAKVLLTCESVDGKSVGEGVAEGAESDVQYVKTERDLKEGNLGPTGWIRQSDVYYFINNMPRRVKFFQEYEDKNLDGMFEPVPNYNLKNTIKDELQVQFSPIRFDGEKIKNVFIYYDIDELYKRNQSFRPSRVWNDTEYDKLIAEGTGSYSEDGVGMYTVENMFGVEENDFTPEELTQMKEYDDLPFLTKVAIAAKFTPRFIFVTKEEWEKGVDGHKSIKEHLLEKFVGEAAKEIEAGQYEVNFLRLQCKNEKVAQEILTHSLRMHGHLLADGEEYDADNESYMYPESTFFAFFRGEQIFYCSYGVASVENSKGENWPEMIPYTRGWSYYYTYINNERSSPVEHVYQMCIERNKYYILKLKSIGTLGTSVGDNRYIEVHTLKSDWQDGGKGDVTIH